MSTRDPIGVLLVNVGTPGSPTQGGVRTFLREFLSDPSVVDVNRALWWLILNGAILPFRSKRLAHAYAAIWTARGSPLLVESERQAELVAATLGAPYRVELGMRYGAPSMAAALERLCSAGCERVVLLPLFPQYSNATTGSVQAEMFRVVASRYFQPALVCVPPYFAEPGLIAALAARVRASAEGRRIAHWVFSFHGLPERYIERGDPYRKHCDVTAHALARELQLAEGSWSIAFQSRFGSQPWLAPYTDQLVPGLARDKRRVLITMPGFSADCLETLEEIGMRLRQDFVAAGGEELVVVPALNDHPLWIETLATLVRRAAS